MGTFSIHSELVVSIRLHITPLIAYQYMINVICDLGTYILHVLHIMLNSCCDIQFNENISCRLNMRI